MNTDSWSALLALPDGLRKVNPILYSLASQSRLLEESDDHIIVGCKNKTVLDYLRTRTSTLETLLQQATGSMKQLEFVIDEGRTKPKVKDAPLLQFTPSTDDYAARAGLTNKYTFENFAVSGTNQVAYSAAMAVAEMPGHAYNPLFLWGGVGVGKTHLAQSVGRVMLEKNPKARIVFCPGDSFTNELIESIQNKTTTKFRSKYRQLNLLIIDDIQFIAGKKTVQEEFFHTFNSVLSGGGQIILTSDKPPQDIDNLESRLVSRFSGGLTVDIQSPDYELRSAILLLKAKDKNIRLDTEIARLIAEQVTDSRALEGTLLSIYARSLSTGGIIDFAMVEQFFQETNPVSTVRAKRRLTPNDVIRAVASFYNLRPAHLKSQTRTSHVALPRQIAMYLLRRELGLKHQEIASFLKRRDHTTILYGVEKVDKLILDNPRVKEEVDRIAQSLSRST